jgi:HAD superfamily hydrolase (TIGR01509 family)
MPVLSKTHPYKLYWTGPRVTCLIAYDKIKAMIQAIFWDNDGVLVDTEHLYYQATRQVLATVGVSLSMEQYIELILIRGTGAFHLAGEKGISPDGIEKLRDERNALYGRLLEQGHLVIDGVREVLKKLSGRCLMGIVTSSRPDHFAIIHQRTGFLKYFRFTITAEDFTHGKPHPEPYLLALGRSGLRADECLVVEDSERGLTAARQAGIRCVVVPNEFTRTSDFTGAYRVLESIRELPGIV